MILTEHFCFFENSKKMILLPEKFEENDFEKQNKRQIILQNKSFTVQKQKQKFVFEKSENGYQLSGEMTLATSSRCFRRVKQQLKSFIVQHRGDMDARIQPYSTRTVTPRNYIPIKHLPLQLLQRENVHPLVTAVRLQQSIFQHNVCVFHVCSPFWEKLHQRQFYCNCHKMKFFS